MIDVEKYVRSQIAVFHANEQRLENSERRPGRGKAGKLYCGPYLLISREKGAGGSTVGQLVGRRLGWQVFDNQIVDEIAKKAQVRRQLVESLDEHDRTTIQDMIGQVLDPKHIGTSDYLLYLKQIVLTLGHQGDVVIVGRGAQFILPGQFGLSVRMVAPIEARIQRIADEAGLSLAAARVEVERTDRERVKLVRHSFGRDVTDPLSHDIIINTAAMKVEAAAEIVLKALQGKLGVQVKDSSRN